MDGVNGQDRLHNLTEVEVLHASSPQYTGAALLPTLGLALRQFLAELSERLLAIEPGTSIAIDGDRIYFQPYIVPQPTIVATRLDMMGRTRRNIIAILNALDSNRPDGELMGARVGRLDGAALDEEVAERIYRFNENRGLIEYGVALHHPPAISDDFWRLLINDYSAIERWAQTRGLEMGSLEKVVGM